ncbi:SBP-type domain-containing protein [Psidium guajava]|nr:SBP-type domain-containing protein [Psidium guajava]
MEAKRSSWSLSLVWLVLLLSLLSLACNVNVEGARTLKSKDRVIRPQNIYGGVGGYYFPGPGTGGALPSPGFVGGVGFGPSGFCTLPGGCVPTGPTVPGSSLGASP